MAKKGGLGRGLGLNALIPEVDIDDKGKVVNLKLIDVEPNENQPRKNFDSEKLDALADSIRTHGVIQPILVTKIGDRYQIIAGERRWRASKNAGLKEIPAIICEYSGEKQAEVALIENLQREDLNPVEEAVGYKTLIDNFSMTQEKVSERVGKSRSAVANSLRILSLDEKILKMLENAVISLGHAKLILSVDKEKQVALAEIIAEKNMTVRETEEYIKNQNKPPHKKVKLDKELLLHIKELEEDASKSVGTKVRIKHKNGKGKIEIEYYSNDDLERLLDFLNKG